MDIFFTAEVETNECLNNNGGCWQDKAANITACKVAFHDSLPFEFYVFLVIIISDSYINVLRIHFVGEFVNALWLMVSSSREMDTATVKVNSRLCV